MSQEFWVASIDWNARTAGLALEPASTAVVRHAPFDAIVFPQRWTCGEPECGMPVHLSWEFERGYARGHFPGRCKASRSQGVKTPGRREMRLLCEGELVEHNRGSKRLAHRDQRRIAREQARVKRGLLANPLRWR